MIYNTLAASKNDTIDIKSEMNKYELIVQIISALNSVSDNNKLTIDVTIITADSRYMTHAGKNYFKNKGLEYIINKYSDNYNAYSLFTILITNHLYIVCPASIE